MEGSSREQCTVAEEVLNGSGLRSEITGTLLLSEVPKSTLRVEGPSESLEWSLRDIGTIRTEKGLFRKKKVAVYGRRRTGKSNTYQLVAWYVEGLGNPEDWVSRIGRARKLAVDFAYNLDKGKDLALRKLRSREQMTFEEIKGVLLSLVPQGIVEIPESDVIDFLERLVNKGDLQGFVDVQRKEFVHAGAHRQTTEIIQYNIATSFDFSDGMLRIKCPSCGSSNIQKVKANESKCAHCGTTYVIPTKILDML